MRPIWKQRTGVALAVLFGLSVSVITSPAGAQIAPYGQKPSMTQSITSGLKKSADGLGKLLKPPPANAEPADPIALSTKAKRPGPELHVRVALLYMQAKKFDEAAAQYRHALKANPKYVGALVGYAHAMYRLGNVEEAEKHYRLAAEAHPNDASVFNNMGAFYAQRGMFPEAITAMDRAVKLQPREVKYRNNLAMVLNEVGNPRAAFGHLQAVHGDAVAYYNLGHLLHKRGQTRQAAAHFAKALQLNPSMNDARTMLRQLQAAPGAAAPPSPARPAAVHEDAVANRPGRPAANPATRSVPNPYARPPHVNVNPAVRQLPPPPRRSGQPAAGQAPAGAGPALNRAPVNSGVNHGVNPSAGGPALRPNVADPRMAPLPSVQAPRSAPTPPVTRRLPTASNWSAGPSNQAPLPGDYRASSPPATTRAPAYAPVTPRYGGR